LIHGARRCFHVDVYTLRTEKLFFRSREQRQITRAGK
jgi:hypothetical protein